MWKGWWCGVRVRVWKGWAVWCKGEGVERVVVWCKGEGVERVVVWCKGEGVEKRLNCFKSYMSKLSKLYYLINKYNISLKGKI